MAKHTLIFRKLIVFVLFFTVHLQAQDRLSGKSFATRSMVIAQNGMACTSHPLATIAAIDILKKGGTAIDAAIAANAVLGVTDPEMDGIGGDLFAIVFDAKTKKLYGLNASGRSPYSLTQAIFKKKSLAFVPWEGPLSVTVPGCVDGWFELHKKFGKIAMPVILAEAINYARNGFPAGNEYANVAIDVLHGLELVKTKADTGENSYYINLMKLYYPGGKPAAEGEIIKNAALANSLEKIARAGRDAFYKGDIAKAIDSYMKKMGGFLSYQDLADHSSNWIEPVSSTYRGYEVWELPPNGQGITVLEILNLLEPYDFSKISYGSPEHIHLFTEATKLAYEDRAKFYADPEFATIPVNQLISKSYAKKRGALINIDKASPDYSSGNPLLNSGETVYLTVADKDGNMISLIQSNCAAFGSKMVPDSLGFVLQNRGAFFNLKEGENNTYAPHKRPFHTIIPAFVTKDNKPFMSFGVMGGGFQPMGHVQILMNIIDFGMNIQEAGDAPRISVRGSSDPTGRNKSVETIALETGFSFETVSLLKKMGHTNIIYGIPGEYGGYQCIQYDPAKKVYYGASDPRKDGMAAGY